MPLLDPRYDALRAQIDELEVGDFFLDGRRWRGVLGITRNSSGTVRSLEFTKAVRNRFAPRTTSLQRHEFSQRISAVAKRGDELPEPPGQVVYFVRDGRLVKIGFTGRLRSRLYGVKSDAGGRELELLGTVPGGRARERHLHARFAHLRQHGEWFTLTDEIRDYIAAQ